MTNIFIVALPIVIAINLLLGVVVLLTRVQRLANRVFAVLSAVIACWLLCQFWGSTRTDEVWLTFWIRQSCATSVFIPLCFHLLRLSVTAAPPVTVFRLLADSWSYLAIAAATGVLCQTQFFLTGAHLAAEPGALAEPVYGQGFQFFVAYWVVAVGALVSGFFRAVMRAEGVCRIELLIMSFGTLFGLVPGVVLILLVPLLTGSSQWAQFTPMTVVIWLGVIAYGIATRHIMEVGEFLRRIVTFALLVALLIALYVAVFLAVRCLPVDDVTLRQTVAHVAAAVAIAVSLSPLSVLLRRGADRWFDDGQERLAQLMRGGGELARSITTVDALFGEFGRLVLESLGLSHLRIYLRQPSGDFAVRANVGASVASPVVPGNDPVVVALSNERCPLLYDVLRRKGGTPQQQQAEKSLSVLCAEAAVALHTKKGVVGFMLLGRRGSGRIFGRGEENALMFLGDQMGIAIENATLYTQLRDAQVYNEVLLENLVTGVVAVDAAGLVTVCNREASRILEALGTPIAVGRSTVDAFPRTIGEEMRASLSSGRGARDRDLTFETATHEERHVRLATAAFGGDGRVASGALAVVHDTTALRKLEEQIRRSDRLASIGTLAAGMAHEIKNPLVCLKTFVQLLPSQYDDPDFRNTFMPLLGSEVERINTIVSQLLNFSRPVKPTLVPSSLHTILEESWQLAAQPLKVKGLSFRRDFAAEDDRILGDQHLLGQVFLNLYLNGIDAMEKGGALSVSTRTVTGRGEAGVGRRPDGARWIEVRVSDTGRGISAENRQRIFDPFFTTKANGTGLGLAVAHGIVLEHQGAIDVESTVGVGTTFRVLLPLLAGQSGRGESGKDGVA